MDKVYVWAITAGKLVFSFTGTTREACDATHLVNGVLRCVS